MILLQRWVVAGVLGLALPLVSPAGGLLALQTGDGQSTQRAGDGQAEKAGAPQEAVPAKVDEDQDLKAKPEDAEDVDETGVGSMPAQAGQDTDLKARPEVDHAAGTGVNSNLQETPSVTRPDQKQKKAEERLVPQEQRADDLSRAHAALPALVATPATPQQIKERQLATDASELLRLVEELKEEVDKAGTNTLSLAALRKAEEIQRLAKTLKERMKDEEQVTQSKP